MNQDPILVCKPSQWFKTRAIIIVLMFLFGSAWFFKDGHWGYRQKNVEYCHFQLFSDSKTDIPDFVEQAKDVFKKDNFTEESWREFASKQTIAVPKDKELLPRDYDYDTKWPKELVDGFDELSSDENKLQDLWKAYSLRMGWDAEAPKALKDSGTIMTQYVISVICLLLAIYALYITLRNFRRTMTVTKTAYYPPGGKEVPYTSMKKLDKRKWDNKGVAFITYEEDGELKKAKVDGFLYGQFKEEDGKPAEALLDYITENFHGEIVEYVDDDDEEETESEKSEETSGESDDSDRNTQNS